ncbi:interferon-induced very large GTPase 1-like [Rhinatrema bivittatum]|uniref:interferon-induced very large GTPase 1-like n=1 Tax=Rhinatrema bivittatum TaxID=194408 RepID=UPI001126179F|nr:interferon-induced very large GTPase 1-like [Rhinatrema bivittatum]
MSREEDTPEDQVLGDPGKAKLVKRLSDVGLNPEYWLPQLQDRFGINSAQALEHLNHEDHLNLQCCVQYSWEKQALQKLLHIPDRETTIKHLQEQRCDLLKKRQEQAMGTLKELQQMQNEGKGRYDDEVKRKEEELKLAMEIPAEYWVPSEKPFMEMIENLHRQLNLMQDSLTQGENISDTEVLRCASGGLALEGIYKTNQLEDLLQKREQLICIPEDFSLLGPEQGPVFQQKEFSSFAAESTFTKSMEKLGYSFSCSAKGGFWGMSFETSIDSINSSESENKQKSHMAHTYISTTKYNYIPLASCYIPKGKLRLSSAALQELKCIEKLLSLTTETEKQNILIRYEKFFKRFGSHVNQGPLHFGGIFWWKASSEGFKKEQLEDIKKMASEALSSYIGASYSGFSCNAAAGIGRSQSQSQASFQGTQRETLQKQIQLCVTKTGGPAEADSLTQWKSGLVTSNKTWSVIDRGFQLVPVWDLILSNHREDFKDAHQFSTALIDAYKAITNENVDGMLFGEQLISAVDDAKSFLQDIANWKAISAKEHLKKLIDFKQKLNEKTGNYSIWISICLSDKVLQDFLSNIAEKYISNPGNDSLYIKSQMRCLIEPHIYSVENFPKSSFIMQWIYDSKIQQNKNVSISEFNQFIEVLQKAKNDIQEIIFKCNISAEAMHEVKVKSTIHVSLSLYSLLKTLRDTNQIDMELLLLSLARSSGYCLESNVFRYLLGLPEIDFLLSKMKATYEEYTSLRKQNVYRAEAFLLLTGLVVEAEDKEVPPEQKQERLHFMTKHLEGHLSSEVTTVLKKYDNSAEWKALEKDLNVLIFENYRTEMSEMETQHLLKELDSVCQIFQQNVSRSKSKNELSNSKVNETFENQHFLNLIKRLDLHKYYPKRMRTDDFHIIDQSSLCEHQPSIESELPFYFLQKLLMLDHRARYLMCKDENNVEQDLDNSLILENLDESSDIVDEFFTDVSEGTHEPEVTRQTPIHPMDVQMAVFLCADNFMRQNLAIKLSFCQFALPLLIPRPCTSQIEFPLWSFRQVKKQWISTTKNKEGPMIKKCKEKSISEAHTHIVSFIRFGDSLSSKSQIVNSLLSKQKHNIFFHRHCRGSSKECHLMKGVVEIAWYCPGGKDGDNFDDCIAFTNLHGDAREHDHQLQFLQEIASVNVILLSETEQNEKGKQILQQFLKSPRPLICLCADKEKIPVGKPGIKVKIGIKNKTEAELVNELTRTIKYMLAVSNSTCSLDRCVNIARRYAFIIDEDEEDCKEGKKEAQILLHLLNEKPFSHMKKHFLPLQGELWHKWCKKDKEFNRLKNKGNKSIEQYRSDIESEKRAIRRDQLKRACPLNDLMKSLLKILNCQSNDIKLYFLQWFRKFIDELSLDHLPILHKKYHDLWSELVTEKQQRKCDDLKINKMQQDLEAVSCEINDSTFGLEHVLRELGQMYEAVNMISEKNESISTLPQIAADLMISGYPIELMDGDTAHVPLKWIGDILNNLIKKLGDKKLFVLSVLGIQSTGKSTLLNAMFGLQFAVSAGRCTRGAFMQLIKVDEKLCQEMNFDFILVIDTEGLRALELANKATLNHDNELATFVIGIGNLTLINIFGENPSEMQDILQIAVQAFLRMKQVKLSPSCLFVHQNVGEITANEKNMEGRRRLQEKLDEMTQTAAEQELCNVRCFSDVIQFDVNTHIHYFAHLWEGDPPMAAPNPSYSQNVQELKNVILTSAKSEFRHSIFTISALKHRIEDLWNALLSENFVFSFRNTIEIAAYSRLEKEYGKWTWKLRSHVLNLQATLNNAIQKEEITNIDILLEKNVQEQYDTIMKDQEEYFNKDKDCEILIQWKANTGNRLKELKQELIAKTKKQCHEMIELKKSQRGLDQNKSKYENELFRRSQKLALQLRGKELSKAEMKESFNTLWNEWITKVGRGAITVQEPNIDADIDQAILENFKDVPNLLVSIENSHRHKTFNFDHSKHIAMKKAILWFKKSFEKCDEENIKHLTTHIREMINEYIQKKEENGMDYNTSYIHEILNTVNGEVESVSCGARFEYKTTFKADLSLYLLRQRKERFREMHKAFQRANDPVTYLCSKREDYFNSFRMSCDGATSVTKFADFLCGKLRGPLQQRVYEKTAIDIVGKMTSNEPAFNGNRSKLENYILISLAEDENFEKYMQYIHFPKQTFKEFIEKRVNDYCSDKNNLRLTTFLNISLDSIQNLLLTAIDEATRVVKDKNGDAYLWLDEFCKRIGNELSLSRNDLRSLDHQDIKDTDFLINAMTKALDSVVDNLKQEFAGVTMEAFKLKPHEILLDQLAGCWNQCPFCSAICTHTIAGHDGDHSVRFHRPEGVTGWKWYKTNHFMIDICTSLVASDYQIIFSENNKIPYKTYREAGPPYSGWSITPDNSSQLYWKWFVSNFRTNLEEFYQRKFEGRGSIPSQWESITKEDAISELKKQV